MNSLGQSRGLFVMQMCAFRLATRRKLPKALLRLLCMISRRAVVSNALIKLVYYYVHCIIIQSGTCMTTDELSPRILYLSRKKKYNDLR